jgi:hypothetical protein
MALLPNITGDTRAGGLHVRHDALSCLAALHAALAAPVVLGQRTTLREVPWDSSGHAWTVATHPALELATRVGMAATTEALSARLAVLREARVRTTGHCACLRGWL